MNDSAWEKDNISANDGRDGTVKYYKKDFWSEENQKFTRPHFRLQRSALIVNKLAQGKECDLLDVGCGPATLMKLLDKNIHYYGIDIAIQEPAPNLIEADLLQGPIKFGDKKFDIVVAQGLFEYLGEFQARKFEEIRRLLRPGGEFVLTYQNFGHRKKSIYWPYSNVQPISDFRKSLGGYFQIKRSFPVSHNWNHGSPQRRWLQVMEMHVNLNIPMISPVLGTEYFFICSPRAGQQARS